MAGNSLVAETSSSIAIYEPRDGSWVGVRRPTTVLTTRRYGGFEGLAATNRVVIAGYGGLPDPSAHVTLIHRPERGWAHGHPRVEDLIIHGYGQLEPSESFAASGNFAILLRTDYYGGVGHECPCGTDVYAISLTGPRPRELARSATATTTGAEEPALSGGTALVPTVDSAGMGAVTLYAVQRQGG